MTPQVFKAVVFKVCSQVPLRQVCDTHRALAADTGSRRVFNLQSLCSGTSEGHTALMPCTCGKVSLWQVREKIPVARRHAPWVTGAQGPGLGASRRLGTRSRPPSRREVEGRFASYGARLPEGSPRTSFSPKPQFLFPGLPEGRGSRRLPAADALQAPGADPGTAVGPGLPHHQKELKTRLCPLSQSCSKSVPSEDVAVKVRQG